MGIYKDLVNKEEKVAVIGLGYVGLPIALALAKKVSVIGFDISSEKVEMMKKNEDPSEELPASEFENSDISFTADIEDLRAAKFYIVAVPTPIDQHNLPDLKPLISASTTVGKVLKKGDYVVFESTVYPGCTEEDCVPFLEQMSGLEFRKDFMVGYSPERINPGDTKHTLQNVVKVVSGCSEASLDEIAKTYELVVHAGVHRAASIKVAEAAKIIENTQRDVNIALINELSIIFNKMGINTYEVLEAAGTKWNFLKYSPGLVGGHCIGVDPYYLTYKAKEFGYHAQIINSGRAVNDGMGSHIAGRITKEIVARNGASNGAKVLVMGATFKENVSDIRNSKVVDVIDELKSFGLQVDVIDPFASSVALEKHYGFSLNEQVSDQYNAILVAVNHDEYVDKDEAYFKGLIDEKGFIFDVKGSLKNKVGNIKYLSL
ncbi:nucleotide sugar dehydrogenase [Vicingaceae bacterium]|nr:nucleotide sugar dehydrogenase [Vicingaceae bacterium]MDB4061042.1 nucleotide sugar dehydrogenase [Vicingaceae bacterium]MDC1451846.1 nucleotide sugar dehydrogenase [Vicingaceae bacterium]